MLLIIFLRDLMAISKKKGLDKKISENTEKIMRQTDQELWGI